jgi:hypothetical protein
VVIFVSKLTPKEEILQDSVIKCGLSLMTTPGEKGIKRASNDDKNYKILKDYLPSLRAALEAWKELVKKVRHAGAVNATDTNIPDYDVELSPEEQARRRYHKALGVSEVWKHFGPRWGVAFTLYSDLLGPVRGKWFRNLLLKGLDIGNIKKAGILFDVLKELGTVVKKHASLLPIDWVKEDDWMVLVNLETFGSYVPLTSIDDYRQEVIDWVTGDKGKRSLSHDGRVWSEKTYIYFFKEHLRRFLTVLPGEGNANKLALTLDQWASNPGNWGNSGATSSKRKLFYVARDGKTRVVGKNKWRTALAMSPKEVVKIVEGDIPVLSVNKAQLKRETGKGRVVVSGNVETYLTQKYFYHWMEKALKYNLNSTLWYNSTMLFDMNNRMSEDCDGKSIHGPVDVQKFDADLSFPEYAAVVEVTMEVMKTRVPQQGVIRDIAKAYQTLVKIMNSRVVKLSEEEIRVANGLLSGEYLTAFIGSSTSVARSMEANRLLRLLSGSNGLISKISQGDDTEYQAKYIGEMLIVVRVVEMMRIPINLSKFFIDSVRTEYLRQVPRKGVVSGYPARGLTSVLWRNPVNRDPQAGILRMREQLSQWNILLGRGMDEERVLYHAKQDMARANGITVEEVDRLLHTPASLGGLGFLPTEDEDRLLGFTTGNKRVQQTLIDRGLGGIGEELGQWKGLGREISRERAVRFCSDFLELPEAKIEVKRGELEQVKWISPLNWKPNVGPNVALEAYMDATLPRTFGRLALELAIEEKDWDWISDVWLAVELRLISKSIQTRGGRGLWIDWLLGKLPWATPIVPGHSELSTSVWYNRYAGYLWSQVIGRWKFGRDLVKRAALTAEIYTYKAMRASDVRQGG